MSENEPEQREDRFERLLDGLLDGPDADAVRREVQADPGLRREAELQSRLDNALRGAFAPPEFSLRVEDRAEEDEPPMVAGRVEDPPARDRRLWLVAALLLICVGLWGRQAIVFLRELSETRYETLAVADIYHNCVDAGFTPDWRCEDDKQFAETFYERQGQAVRLGRLPDGSEMVGLAYLDGFTENSTAMLARVDGQPVLILAERTERVPSGASGGRGVNVHSLRLGPLTLLELSPFDEPRVAQHLELLDQVPAEDTGRVPGEGE